MTHQCQWFRCDDPATVTLAGCDLDTEEPRDAIGELCLLHYAELASTLALYAHASALRRARPLEEAESYLHEIADPNTCQHCGHGSGSHMFASLDRRAYCVACTDNSKLHDYKRVETMDGPLA